MTFLLALLRTPMISGLVLTQLRWIEIQGIGLGHNPCVSFVSILPTKIIFLFVMMQFDEFSSRTFRKMPKCKQKRTLRNLVLLSEGNTCAERCCTQNDHELIMTDTTDHGLRK